MEVMNSNPLISISCITYNHAPFIRACLDSFLLQQTNFAFEVIIHDDASTDETKEIIEEYTAKYPDVFFPLFQTKNQYSQGVRGMMARFNFPRCRGKYIALCEGDDYWTDPFKLQKQVDFLEANSYFALCFHKANELNEFNPERVNIFPNIKEDHIYSIQDYILNNWTATCSMVFNKKYYRNENWFNTLPFGDLGLALILMKNSNNKAMVLKEIMGTYRIHSGGVHGNLQENPRKLIEAYKQHLVFAKIIKEKLLFESIYSKYYLKKKIQTYTQLYQLYEKEGLYFKGLINKMFLFFLRVKYRLLY
jgi:glycosyltransferase involved in cell wall biosynthesis